MTTQGKLSQEGLLMDYNVVRTYAINAAKTYKRDDKKYKESMTDFYKAGKENPSVANVILHNSVNERLAATRDFSDAMMKSELLTASMDPARNAVAKSGLALVTESIKNGMDAMEMPKDESLNSTIAKQEYDKAYETLYPKTGKLRKMFAESGQIKMDKVTPKMSWSQKVMNLIPAEKFNELYPKTIFVRTKLMLEGQIDDKTVTPRVKGFFNRLSHKMLIKNGFSFAKKVVK